MNPGLTQREERATDGSSKRSEGAPRGPARRKLAEARKEAEKLRERGGERKLTITEQAERKKLRVLLPVLRQKRLQGWLCRKIPLINKMMINWAEKQAPEDVSN